MSKRSRLIVPPILIILSILSNANIAFYSSPSSTGAAGAPEEATALPAG